MREERGGIREKNSGVGWGRMEGIKCLLSHIKERNIVPEVTKNIWRKASPLQKRRVGGL